MGEVDFDEQRLEAISERGIIIAAGQRVKVVAVTNGMPTVRPDTVTSAAPSAV
jgi:hypothetical protein